MSDPPSSPSAGTQVPKPPRTFTSREEAEADAWERHKTKPARQWQIGKVLEQIGEVRGDIRKIRDSILTEDGVKNMV